MEHTFVTYVSLLLQAAGCGIGGDAGDAGDAHFVSILSFVLYGVTCG